MEIREALAKAAETSAPESLRDDTSSTPAPAVETTTAEAKASGPDAPSPAASARARDEQGRFTTKPDEKPAEKVAAAPKAGANGAAAAAPPAAEGKAGAVDPPTTAPAEPAPEKPVEPAVKAPQSWRPAAREKWSALPAEVQTEVARREREIQTKLNEVAQTTKTAHEFHQAAAPWEALFRSQGISATQFLDIAARTQYTLTAGSPQQKAQVFAQLIQQSGVPIEVLDAALAGQPAQAPQAVDPAHIAQQVEQRVQARFAQQAQAVAAQRTQARLASFAESHEFYPSVRDRMADILAARGKTDVSDKELEEVYDLACRIDPEVSGVVRQREAAKAARTTQADTERTKAAASSVRSTPAAAPARTAQPKSIHEALAAAAEATGFGR